MLFLDRRGTGHTKYSHWMTSEVTAEGLCSVLVADLNSVVYYRDFNQNGQKVPQKWGYPLKNTIFNLSQGTPQKSFGDWLKCLVYQAAV